MYRVVLQKHAERFYAEANRPLARKLARCFRILAETPRCHPNIKPLSGELAGRYRFRAGSYRIVYLVVDATSSVHVTRIAHRREVYR